MYTFKRLFITLAVLVLSLGISQAVYANEPDQAKTSDTTLVATDIEDNDNEANTPDETSDTLDREGEFDPEVYEIYIDEQGQVFYFEREPEEIEIVDSDEIVEDDVIPEDEELVEAGQTAEGNEPTANEEAAVGKDAKDSNEAKSSDKAKSGDEAKNSDKAKSNSDVKSSDKAADSDKKASTGTAAKEEKTTEKEAKKTEQKEKAKKPAYSAEDLRLLACLVYSEAGNQSYNGMLAVANVVLNRVKSSSYSHVNTIKEVIYDKKWAVQFSVTIKSKSTGKSLLDKALEAYDTGKFSGKNPEAEKKAMEKAIKAAKAALNGENNIGNYLCFRMNNSGAKKIKKTYSDYVILGSHIFYRTK